MKRRLLTLAFLTSICACMLCAQIQPERIEFEVASIRPSAPVANGQRISAGVHIDGTQYNAASLTLKDYIRIAYRMKDHQIMCADWVGSERFDISAKIPDGALSSMTPEMLQALLKSRFALNVHKDKKEFPVYALVVSKPGLLKETPTEGQGDTTANAPVEVVASGSHSGTSSNLGNGSFFSFADNKLESKKLPMSFLADALARFVDRPVVDATELKSNYDLKLELTPEDYRAMLVRAALSNGVVLPPEALKALEGSNGDSLHAALAKVGLKLEPRRAPLDILIVDHAEKSPTAN